MKKKYIIPETHNFNLEVAYNVLDGTVTTVDDDDEIGYGGPGDGDANAKDRDIYEEGMWLEEMADQESKKSLW